jgi:hypothetical protein
MYRFCVHTFLEVIYMFVIRFFTYKLLIKFHFKDSLPGFKKILGNDISIYM